MRIVYKIAHWYNTYQMFMWIAGGVTSVVIPFAGYGIYYWQRLTAREDMAVGSPEHVSDITIGNPLEWLTGMLGDYGWILGIVALLGLALILFCIVFKIVSFFTERTELTGTDKTSDGAERVRRRYDAVETYDDYGASGF